MQILRFEEATPTAPKRKKSSMGYVALGLVATVFGLGSAFASSTITINAANEVNLGQGVVTVSGCDSNIGFKPVTKLSSDAASFQVTDFIIGDDFDGSSAGLIDTTACNLAQMKITLYKNKVSGPGIDLVTCASTYNGVAAGGSSLKGTKVEIGKISTPIENFPEYVADYKCGTDGSFYFEMNSSKGMQSGSTMKIRWRDQADFKFDANSFDHVTIESVSGETGLSGV